MAEFCDETGIEFEYPDNWTVEEQPEPQLGSGQVAQVAVASPETAFWQLSKHRRDTPLESLFDEALAALRAEYREIEVTPIRLVLERQPIDGYDVNFYYLDFTVTSCVRGFQRPEGTFLVVFQAEDREMERVEPVFEAMLASMLRRLA